MSMLSEFKDFAVKVINRLKRQEAKKPTAPPEPSEEVLLLRDIRDALNKGS